ncbi:DUF11 domain-containing protein [Ramlibacter sp. G-1-2-2]|uniref:DUF11 domain-containing protein n=1 Tax=Ramlibacter agri TaxID=2728837 RepID=A0A848H1R2_9BURK|nr:DUF11 domain-containing protein [Ramlibacter agri]NML43449.1 DUF11 domain-containing protein [Ramlibacter agri]
MRFRFVGAACLAVMVAACGGGSGGGGAESTSLAKSNLVVTATGPTDPVPAGTTVPLVVDVANNGEAAATDVAVSATLDARLTLKNATCSAAGGATCPPLSGTTFTPPAVPPGGSLHFEFEAAIAAGSRGALVSTLSATAGNGGTPAGSSAQALVTAYSADVAVWGYAPAALPHQGDRVDYTFVVWNIGPDAARNVSIVDTLGPGLLPGATISCRSDGAAPCPAAVLGAEMTVPNLPSGGVLTFTILATVAADSTTVGNSMQARAAGDPRDDNSSFGLSTGVLAGPASSLRTSIALQGDAGDFITQGSSYSYTLADAVVTASASGNRFNMNLQGDENWSFDLQLPDSAAALQHGAWTGLPRYAAVDPAVGALSITGQGRGCNQSSGAVTINNAWYASGQLVGIDLDFSQQCDASTGTLRGHITWSASDPTLPAGPVNPLPAGLWTPAPASLPASGSYVALSSDTGDYVGAGVPLSVYTRSNAVLSLLESNGRVTVSVGGNESWSGDFVVMNSLSQLQPGYYGNLRRYPFNNPKRGGLSWYGQGRGCNTLSGWFTVDSVMYDGNGRLSRLDLRFEQHCEFGSPALHGVIHWDASDTAQPAGPAAEPAGLWTPPPGATPGSGNYVYLASDVGDYIGGGATSILTDATSTIQVTANGALAVVRSGGAGGWTGSFAGMNTLSRLQPGYYAGLQRYPFNNQALGGLDWSGEGRGCNTLKGWFMVDAVSYDALGALSALDLRFEQHCEGVTPALRGKVHWVR